MNKKNLSLFAVLALSLVLILSGCSGGSSYPTATESLSSGMTDSYKMQESFDYSTEEELPSAMAEEMLVEDGGELPATTPIPVAVTRKIVRTVNVNLQTKEYDNGIKTINTLVEKYKGYYALSNIQGGYATVSVSEARYADFEAKIPAGDLDAFLAELQEPFHVLSLSESAEDITRTYYDNEAQIAALEERRERLEGMLEGATELEVMLELEREIADTIAQINILYSRQEVMKASVDLATVRITLREVVEYQPVQENPVTFGEEASFAFRSAISDFVTGARNFALFFIANFPSLIVFAIVIILIILFLRQQGKKTRARNAQQREAMMQARQGKPEIFFDDTNNTDVSEQLPSTEEQQTETATEEPNNK